jgi:hypothetical protein
MFSGRELILMEGINSNNAMKQIEMYLLFHCNVERFVEHGILDVLCRVVYA